MSYSIKKILGFSRKVDSGKPQRRYTFVFPVRRGEGEIQAALLAASLKRNLRCKFELVACLPDPDRFGRPSLETLSFLKTLGVRLADLPREPGEPGLTESKIACLRIPTSTEKIVLLASDMVCTGPFGDEARFLVPFNVKPVDRQPPEATRAAWRLAYAAALLEMPDREIAATTSGESGPPCFDPDFVAANSGEDLAVAWQYCARRLTAGASQPGAQAWAEKASLAVAVHLTGRPYDLLDEHYSYPAHLRPLKPGAMPIFTRYRGPSVLRREPQLNLLVQELAAEHAALAGLLRADPEWAQLLEPYAVRPRRAWRGARPESAFEGCDMAITGMPRGGVGYLADLLRQFDNCAVFKEPGGITDALRDDPVPTRAAACFRDLRRVVLDRVPLLESDGHRRVAGVEASDFVLGVCSHAFLPRLDVLSRDVMPSARFVACVRNPFDAIASWKREGLPCGYAGHRLLGDDDRAKLQKIEGMTDLAERCAWWWSYLAEVLLRNRGRLHLVHYESIVRDPMRVLNEILAGMEAGRPRTSIVPGVPRSSRELLDPRDVEAIREICAEPARALGVPLT